MLLVVAKKMGRRLRAREKKPRAPEARVNPSRREKDARVLPLARPLRSCSPPRRSAQPLRRAVAAAGTPEPRNARESQIFSVAASYRYRAFPVSVVPFFYPPNPNVIFAKRAFVSFTPS